MIELTKGDIEYIYCSGWDAHAGADFTINAAVFEVFDSGHNSVQAEDTATIEDNGTETPDIKGLVDTSQDAFISGSYYVLFTMTIGSESKKHKTWFSLSGIPVPEAILSEFTTLDARYINAAADTMLGSLSLAGAPTLDLHASTKKYVDDVAGALNTGRAATLIVAANNSSALGKAQADYVCDGTDDHSEINTAIASLSSGQVMLLEGNYAIGASIVIGSNITLEGMGAGTVLTLNAGVDDRMFINSDRSSGNVNICIRNLYIDGNNDQQSAIGPIDGLGNAGCIDFWKVSNVIIENNYIVSPWATGIEMIQCSNVIIKGNYVDDSADDGIAVNDQSSYIVIAENIVVNIAKTKNYGGPNGIEVQDNSSKVAIVGNVIKIIDASISIAGIAVNTHTGQTAPDTVSILGNSIYFDSTQGPWFIAIDGVSDSFASGISIMGNTMYSTKQVTCVGIRVSYAKKVTITGNTVNKPKGYGIRLTNKAEKVVISNNHITDQNGIHFYDTSGGPIKEVIISNNIIETYYAIVFSSVIALEQISILANKFLATWDFYFGAVPSAFTNFQVKDNNFNTMAYYPTDTDITSWLITENIGFATEASGTATVASGQTSVDVTHGLAITPSINDIHITPTNSMGNAAKYYISNVGATTFRINVDIDPGATTAIFSWAIGSY